VAGGEEIAIYNVGGEFFATSDVCSHDEASLSDGELFGHVVECPLHGARFDVRTGKPLSLPAVYPVKTFEVRVVDDQLQVRV
jgi:nitrite reductase/ring-hydroxylating ferredoxin subunit